MLSHETMPESTIRQPLPQRLTRNARALVQKLESKTEMKIAHEFKMANHTCEIEQRNISLGESTPAMRIVA